MALKLTPSGTDLLLRAIAGEADIEFTAIQFGNGADAGAGAAALSNPLLTAEISSYEIGDIMVTLTSTFSNSEVSAGFRATELGVLAKDPDNSGGTLLYAYQYTPEGESDYIPASADKVLETQMDVMVYIGDAANVTASISESLVYASRAELEVHIQDASNPHKVTKEQVGLGSVPNVATNDQTPTYTMAGTLTALVSGERLSAAMGKLARAVSSLISHLGTLGKNVHKETPASIGAAAASHQHSTADITSGVLGTARGGTGVTSYKSLLSQLGLSDAVLHRRAAVAFPESRSWRAVAYGNGRFVAVGTGNAAYSTDGLNWTVTNTPGSSDWYGIAYGNGKFVAVGSNADDSICSEDGISWTTGTLPDNGSWSDVAYGNGKFVAVHGGALDNMAAYSEDGINWSAATLPNSSGYWRTVAYLNGKFIALSTTQVAAYSEDGISWTEMTMPNNIESWQDAAYGNGKYVAVAADTDAAYSEDGISWTATTLPSSGDGYWRAVTHGNGKFVAIFDSSAGKSSLVAYSTDGINWTAAALPSGENWKSVNYANGRFVAVSSDTAIAISVDGINWTETVSALTTIGGQDITLEILTSMELLKNLGEG